MLWKQALLKEQIKWTYWELNQDTGGFNKPVLCMQSAEWKRNQIRPSQNWHQSGFVSSLTPSGVITHWVWNLTLVHHLRWNCEENWSLAHHSCAQISPEMTVSLEGLFVDAVSISGN